MHEVRGAIRETKVPAQKGTDMPVMFILSVIMLFAAIIAVSAWGISNKSDRPISGFIPVGVFALFVVSLFVSSVTMVGTKNYGVVTTFGAPSDDTLDAGFSFKAPWQKVTDIDATIQPDEYDGDDAFSIKLGNGSIAKIDTTIRWRIVGSKANELFQDYRKNDDVTAAVRTALVKRELNGALNQVFGSYDPLAAVKGGENVSVDSQSAAVETAMRKRVEKLGRDGAQVEILSVTTPLIRLDSNTQEKIDQYQSQVALTRIAEEKEQTNAAEARANAAIASSITDPLVLTNKCLSIMETLAKTKSGVPAGLYCFPGGNAGVVVPGSTR